MDQEISALIAALAEVLKELFEDDPVIALAGAHAKGTADRSSDLDIFVFGRELRPLAFRQKLIEDICDGGCTPWVSESLDLPWGGSADFTYKGIKVETVLRTQAQTEQAISRCLKGDFDIIPQTWTSNGYYTYIYLSELEFLKPIHDPGGWLERQKQKAAVFPPKLRAAIIDTFLGRTGTWIGNFHYASAIEREDTLFIAPIVVHTLMDMVQVIYALNGRYFTGDKKLGTALRQLPYCPHQLLDNLELLTAFPKDRDILRRQAEILTNVYHELEEHR